MVCHSSKIRLFLDTTLQLHSCIELNAKQSRYLFAVMRLEVGKRIQVIDGCTGEYIAEIIDKKRKTGMIKVVSKLHELLQPPDLWLLFAPIKPVRTKLIIEKATELGVTVIKPVITERTNYRTLNLKRLRSVMIEALEQCGGTFLPKLEKPTRLDTLLSNWPSGRSLIHCNEKLTEEDKKINYQFPSDAHPSSILIGPEGGFSDEEVGRIHNLKFVKSVCLGPRVLRADTAVISAIAIWQSTNGYW